MSPAQLSTLLGRILSESADWQRPLDGFQNSQLKSACSIARHLTTELRDGPAVAARFRHDLTRALGDAGTDPERRAVAAALAADAEMGVLGAVLADLLHAARRHPGPQTDALRDRIRALLRDLADAEITVLSDLTRPTTGGHE